MNCFHHESIAAIGTCRHCCRGLCRDCAVEVSGVLACRGRCEQAVQTISSTLRASALSAYLYPIVWLLVGPVLVFYGRKYPGSGMFPAGLIMIGAGCWYLNRTRRRSV